MNTGLYCILDPIIPLTTVELPCWAIANPVSAEAGKSNPSSMPARLSGFDLRNADL